VALLFLSVLGMGVGLGHIGGRQQYFLHDGLVLRTIWDY